MGIETEIASLSRHSAASRVLVGILASALLAVGVLLASCGSGGGEEVQSSSESSEVVSVAPAQDVDSAAANDPAALARAQSRKLQGALAPLATSGDMDVSITCIDLNTDATVSIAGMNQQPASSLIKLAVAAAYFDNEVAGVISRDEEHTIMDYEIVGGSGVYKDMAGQTITMGDAVRKMLSNSDNVATNIIIDRLGMYTINSSLQKLGFNGTQVVTNMLDPDNSRWSSDNTMTSDDAASLLKQVYEHSLVSPEACDFMLEALRAEEDREGLLNGLPEGTSCAHKTAGTWNARHDAGIIEGDNPYVLVVMCSQQDEDLDYQAAIDLIAQAASAANTALVG